MTEGVISTSQTIHPTYDFKTTTNIVPFDFETELKKLHLEDSVHRQCMEAFNNQEYAETLDLIILNQTDNDTTAIIDFLQQARDIKYDLMDQSIHMPIDYKMRKGVFIAKAEGNPEKAFPYLYESIKVSKGNARSYLLAALITSNDVPGNGDRCIEVCEKIIDDIETITPESLKLGLRKQLISEASGMMVGTMPDS